MSAITLFGEVPESILIQVISEISNFDWGSDLTQIANGARTLSFRDIESSSLGEFISTDRNMNIMMPAVITLISWLTTATNSHLVGKLRLSLLPAGEEIPDHSNTGDYYTTYARYHIPLVTHEGVKLVTTQTQSAEHLAVGNIYLLSDQSHSFINNSTVDRIHLIVDLA